MGSGKNIRVFQDAWVLGIRGHRLQQTRGMAEQEELKVGQLIGLSDRKWVLDRIRPITMEEEREAIKSIYLRKALREDKLIWPTLVTGVETPKMVYRRLRELEPESSNTNEGGNEATKQTERSEKRYGGVRPFRKLRVSCGKPLIILYRSRKK